MSLTATRAGDTLDAGSIDSRLDEVVTDLNAITNGQIVRRGLGPEQIVTQVVEWPTHVHIEHASGEYRNGYPGFGDDTFDVHGGPWPHGAAGWLIVNTLSDAGGGSNAEIFLAGSVDLVNDDVIGIVIMLHVGIKKITGYDPADLPGYFGVVHFKLQARVPGPAWVSIPETDTYWRPVAGGMDSKHKNANFPMRFLLRAGNDAAITDVDGFRLLTAVGQGGEASEARSTLTAVDLGAVVLRGGDL